MRRAIGSVPVCAYVCGWVGWICELEKEGGCYEEKNCLYVFYFVVKNVGGCVCVFV